MCVIMKKYKKEYALEIQMRKIAKKELKVQCICMGLGTYPCLEF